MNNNTIMLENITHFNVACGNTSIESDMKIIIDEMDYKNDFPILFYGILKEFCTNRPQYYWNRNASDLVFNNLNKLIQKDEKIFIQRFMDSQTEFFESIRAYENITSIVNELENVVYDPGLKTKIFRNPVYIQICEDYLMNLFRVIRNIENGYAEKNYSNQNTLGKIIPVLNRLGYSPITDIDVNIRNAINHGNLLYDGNNIIYRYGQDPNNYNEKEINPHEFDQMINESYDLACGIIIGIINVLSQNHTTFQEILSNEKSQSTEWFRLSYRTENTNLLYLTTAIYGKPQLNMHLTTSIKNKNNLIFALIQIIKGGYYSFPNFERYHISYDHLNSIPGFLRIPRNDLERCTSDIEIYKNIIKSNDYLISDIIKNDNIQEYKFYKFPVIKNSNYEIINVKDVSINEFKRLRADLILLNKMKKSEIKKIAFKVINTMKGIYTPPNPHENTKYGEVEADMIFLHVFLLSKERKSYTLFPNNKYFICLVHHYQDKGCPRLKFGGLDEKLWNQYKKENIRKGLISWNPNY